MRMVVLSLEAHHLWLGSQLAAQEGQKGARKGPNQDFKASVPSSVIHCVCYPEHLKYEHYKII